MKKDRKKIFGIGAAILMILLAIVPMVSSLSLETAEKMNDSNFANNIAETFLKYHGKYTDDREELEFREYISGTKIELDPNIVYYDSDHAVVKLTEWGQIIKVTLKTGCKVVDTIWDIRCFLFEMRPDLSVEEFIEMTEPIIDVEWVEINALCSTSWEPNDPLYPQQWGLPVINCPKAWNNVKGAILTVAIIDTGINCNHKDINAINGPDFVNDDDDSTDDNGHGTAVAGVVAAEMNNGIGVTGVADVHLMSVKVLDHNGWGNTWNIAKGIVWASTHGGVIINLSLGGPFPSLLLDLACWWVLGFRSSLVVAAAGNNGGGLPIYPARFRVVLSVGAIGKDKKLCDWSNRGADVCAPGLNILTTARGGGYEEYSGTSLATPYVCGVAALCIAAHGPIPPKIISGIIQLTAKRVLGTQRGLVNANAVVTFPFPYSYAVNPSPFTQSNEQASNRPCSQQSSSNEQVSNPLTNFVLNFLPHAQKIFNFLPHYNGL